MIQKPRAKGFTIGKFIGRGSFGDVWIAIHNKSGNRFACKRIMKSTLQKNKRFDMINQEIQTMISLNHQNIIKFHSFQENEIEFLLFLDLCDTDLDNYVMAHGRIPEIVALDILKQILISLAKIHENGICHRDLKPSNVLIKDFPFIVLSDFGFSIMMDQHNLVNETCGTLSYIAPEVFSGKYDGCAADIWSAGLVFYFMVKGKVPWDSISLATLENQKIDFCEKLARSDSKIDRFLSRLMCNDYSKRYSAIRALDDPIFHGPAIHINSILRSDSASQPVFSSFQMKKNRKYRISFENE